MVERKRPYPRVSLRLNRDGGANPADGPAADINSIVAQYKKSGTVPQVTQRNPLYGDFTFPEDIHEIREASEKAEDRFMDLPSQIREAAQHDWVTFLDMFNNEEGMKILEKAGLKITETPIPNNSPKPETAEKSSPSKKSDDKSTTPEKTAESEAK